MLGVPRVLASGGQIETAAGTQGTKGKNVYIYICAYIYMWVGGCWVGGSG